MGIAVSEPSGEDRYVWYELDGLRLELERRKLRRPWNLVLNDDGRYTWEGGRLSDKWRGVRTPQRTVRLIYPYGFPARFIEARIVPDPPRELWGAYGAHVNVDGSACYVNADGWSPQDTVADALSLLKIWWWNYYWINESDRQDLKWPRHGRVEV
jgi:hypothetical protein